MFQGLRTIIYHVEDLPKVKEWYTELLGFKPYFDEVFYVGFNVGGYELGLDPNPAPHTKGNHSITYWGVDNMKESFERIKKMNAKVHSEISNVGGEIEVASFYDPFGNIIGIIYNPEFKLPS
jgi:predicted enzyme related to lactoylglutathione lyase